MTGKRQSPATVPPGKTLCLPGRKVGVGSGLDWCGKSRTHRGSSPGHSSVL